PDLEGSRSFDDRSLHEHHPALVGLAGDADGFPSLRAKLGEFLVGRALAALEEQRQRHESVLPSRRVPAAVAGLPPPRTAFLFRHRFSALPLSRAAKRTEPAEEVPVADRSVVVRLRAEVDRYVAGMKKAQAATSELGRELTGQGKATKQQLDM